MKRALSLLVLGTLAAGASVPAMAETGTSLLGSVYIPTVKDTTSGSTAHPDGLMLEVRQQLNPYFWIGGNITTALSSDQVNPTTKVDIGTSLSAELGLQNEFAHHVFGYAYVGYGKATLDISGAGTGNLDGNSVTWGAGVQFLLGNNILVDAGYASLFNGDMTDSAGNSSTISIAGPRVGLGVKF